MQHLNLLLVVLSDAVIKIQSVNVIKINHPHNNRQLHKIRAPEHFKFIITFFKGNTINCQYYQLSILSTVNTINC